MPICETQGDIEGANAFAQALERTKKDGQMGSRDGGSGKPIQKYNLPH